MSRYCTVLVTGSNGFIGQHLCTHLLEKDFHVIGVGRRAESSQTGDRFTYVSCDLLDPVNTVQLLAEYQPQYVIHLASVKSVSASWENPLETLATNFMGCLHLLEAVRTVGKDSVKRVIVVGSSHDAIRRSDTDGTNVTADERSLATSQRGWPASPYGWSKLLQAYVARLYADLFRVPVLIARTHNLVGPGMTDGVCAELCRQLVEIEQGKRLPELVVGNVDIERDFLDVRDAAGAYASLLRACTVKPAQIYDVCSGRAHSIRSIITLLHNHSARPFTTVVDLTRIRTNEPLVICGNNEMLRQNTKWQAMYSLDASVLDGLNDYRRRC